MKPSNDNDSITNTLSALADFRRRFILYYLDEQDADTSFVTLDEIAEYIATHSHSIDESVTGEDLRVELHHHHLPMLDDTPILTYETKTKTVHNWEEIAVPEWIDTTHPEHEKFCSVFTNGLGECSEV